MKKLVTFSAICIIASILFSSCKSGLSLTKRHYTKGYYVSHVHSKSKTKIAQTTPKIAELEKADQVKISEPLMPLSTLADQNLLVKYKAKVPEVNNNILTAGIQIKQIKKGSHAKSTQVLNHKIKMIKNTETEINNKLSSSKKLGKASREDEGLSLLWIVIVVILILWILGFLAEGLLFGGFIHLLLLIALVLLVLWLLRII